MNFLVIPRIKIQRANALATPWAVTLAPIFACTLFAHALGRDVRTQPIAVGMVHHDAQLLAEQFGKGGYGFYPQQFRAASYVDGADYSSKNKYALSLQPTVSMNLELSLILLFPDAPPSDKSIQKALFNRRIAGGLILEHGEPFSVSSLDEVLRRLSGGFFVLDRSHELRSPDKGRVERLLSLVNDSPPEGEKRRWLSPAVLGYAALTGFEPREGVRENHPHAFSEPLVGLVEYLGVSQLKKLGDLRQNNEFPCFWRGKWLADDVYVLQSVSLSTIQQEINDE